MAKWVINKVKTYKRESYNFKLTVFRYHKFITTPTEHSLLTSNELKKQYKANWFLICLQIMWYDEGTQLIKQRNTQKL